jgi:hypothetical protein
MIKELLNFFKKEEKQQEKINYELKVKSYYPENYPIDGDPDKRFAYFVENNELIPLVK